MAVTSAANVADFSPTVVSLEALDAMDDATNNMVVQNSLDVSDELAAAGALDIPVFPQVDLSDETEGTPLVGVSLASSKVTITPDTRKAVTIPITDYARALSNQELMNGYGRQAGKDASRLIDTSIAGVYSETSQTPVDAGAGVDIDEVDILASKETLDGANASPNSRVLILHHSQYNAILAISGLVRFDAVGKPGDANAIISGVIGKLHGFLVMLDQNMVVAASRRHNIATVYDGTKQGSAIGHGLATFRPMISNTLVAGNRMRLIWTYDTTLASEVLRAQVFYGYKALRPEWIVDVQTADA